MGCDRDSEQIDAARARSALAAFDDAAGDVAAVEPMRRVKAVAKAPSVAEVMKRRRLARLARASFRPKFSVPPVWALPGRRAR